MLSVGWLGSAFVPFNPLLSVRAFYLSEQVATGERALRPLFVQTPKERSSHCVRQVIY